MTGCLIFLSTTGCISMQEQFWLVIARRFALMQASFKIFMIYEAKLQTWVATPTA
jgi:hypothetical protein